MSPRNEKADDVAETRLTGAEKIAQSAWLKIIGTAALTLAPIVIGSYATKILEHLDRIDTFMANSDKSAALLKQDVDGLKALVPVREAQIKEIRDLTMQNKYELDAVRDRISGARK